MMKLFYVKTFGCQMNEHDSLKMANLLALRGYRQTEKVEEADLILFNTCTVRQKAHDKAFSEIGKAIVLKNVERRTQNPSTPLGAGSERIIGVCGCMAQEEGSKLLSRFPKLDLIFGPDQIDKLPALLDLIAATGKPAIATELANRSEDYHFLDGLKATRLHGPCAYVTIMKGCNSQCSYCIVPKVRGSEVYRRPKEIIDEICFLVERGCKEVTLLGQNVNSYGNGSSPALRFAQLIRLISENTDVQRIRFTSPHPKDVKEDLMEEYAVNPKLCSHIHLPLQSGSDAVLQRMRRAYNRRTYLEKVEKLRRARAGIAITTDMIVGFPKESEEEFAQTLDCIRQVRFDSLFGFKYSPRPDTKAYSFEDDIPLKVKEERLAVLLTLQQEISRKINERHVGEVKEVLAEGRDKKGEGKWMGRTLENKIVNFAGHKGVLGAIVNVEVTKATANSMEGRLIEDGDAKIS